MSIHGAAEDRAFYFLRKRSSRTTSAPSLGLAGSSGVSLLSTAARRRWPATAERRGRRAGWPSATRFGLVLGRLELQGRTARTDRRSS